MNFAEFSKYPITFILKFSTLILTEKIQSHFFTVTETFNSATSQTQVSVIQSQNQQQPIVPIQQLFQHSSHNLNVLQFNHKHVNNRQKLRSRNRPT